MGKVWITGDMTGDFLVNLQVCLNDMEIVVQLLIGDDGQLVAVFLQYSLSRGRMHV